MVMAMPLANKDPQKSEAAQFYFAFARYMLSNRGYLEAWRLEYLTDLATLPDYEEGWYYYGEAKGAPVDERRRPSITIYPKHGIAPERTVNDGAGVWLKSESTTRPGPTKFVLSSLNSWKASSASKRWPITGGFSAA